ELQDLAASIDGDLLGQVTLGNSGGDLGDVADLAGEVGGHVVHRVGIGRAWCRGGLHLSLTAELALGAHLAGHTGDLVGERGELVDHGVDGVLQLEDLALDVDGDLLGEVALGHRGGDLGDVANLAGEVGSHVVHRV